MVILRTSNPAAEQVSPDSDVLQQQTPYELIGGEAVVRELVKHFYQAMAEHEPQLARLHQCDEQGRVSAQMQERFALFLIGWLGGPQDYMAKHGHPRLRMRHGRVPVNVAMRDAWVNSMQLAMNAMNVSGPVRSYLDARFADVADFLRNVPG